MTPTDAYRPPHWTIDAPCTRSDPEAWFPEQGRSSPLATQICKTRCPARDQCLDEALERNERFGIWGGMTTPERDREAARRQAAQREDTEAA